MHRFCLDDTLARDLNAFSVPYHRRPWKPLGPHNNLSYQQEGTSVVLRGVVGVIQYSAKVLPQLEQNLSPTGLGVEHTPHII